MKWRRLRWNGDEGSTFDPRSGADRARPDRRRQLAGSVVLAQNAEQLGYERVWYAEHHNIASIASSATSVLIALYRSTTATIRLGAGGIMLPNHAPLTVAEQFGTLAAMYPGRIDLGLGRAPGSDQVTMRALRRDPRSSDAFPQDVLELQGFLGDHTRIPGWKLSPERAPMCPSTSWGPRSSGRSWPQRSGCPHVRASHFTPADLLAASRPTGMSSGPRSSWTSRT